MLAKNINASRSNTTRFAVFSRAHTTEEHAGKHSILMFTVRNEAGYLAKAIQVIGQHGFNMRCLRSRPMKSLLWQYYFYVEIGGSTDTEDGNKMMEELSHVCDKLKVAGTFATRVEI